MAVESSERKQEEMILCYLASDGVTFSVGQGNHRDLRGVQGGGWGKILEDQVGFGILLHHLWENTACLR